METQPVQGAYRWRNFGCRRARHHPLDATERAHCFGHVSPLENARKANGSRGPIDRVDQVLGGALSSIAIGRDA
jgi:hypothetical protein